MRKLPFAYDFFHAASTQDAGYISYIMIIVMGVACGMEGIIACTPG